MLDLRWILETLPVGVWVARVPTGEVTYANPRFRAIMGMDAVEELKIGDAPATYGIFDRLGQLYPVDQLPFSLVVYTRSPATVDDMVIHRPDGGKANVRAFAYPKFDDDKNMTHVVVAFVDITAEVKAVVEREKMEARLALAVNHAPIAIWGADIRGVVTLSEGAGLEALGVKSGELVGQSLFDLYKDHPTIPGYIRRGLLGESFWYTVQVGKATYDTWLMPIRDAAGSIVGVAGVSKDVSEIRALQARAIQNDRAIALGTLAASVAHEINNPLTYMLGQQELLSGMLDQLSSVVDLLPESVRGQYQGLEGQIHKALEPVRSGTERIASITRELQTFNRPAAQRSGLVDVRAVVDSVLKLVRKELEARARLEMDLQPTAPVLGDSTRLLQVVMNLVVNAMQSLPANPQQDGVVWIHTRNEDSTVLIEVADSGPGILPEDRERIFEPFVTTKGVGEGTGLGLFVCRNIVRDFSGKVTVGDRPGGGALFRVELPAAPTAPPVEPARQPVPATPPFVAHVLIIEDEFLVGDLLARQLSRAGYTAIVEQDSLRALEKIATAGDSFDLIYCDMMMKGMSGMELADALVDRAPDQLKKIVFMTGGAFTPLAQAFREVHPEQCIDKPFDILAETSLRLNRLRQS
jgi:PAS domain S-box-containing protein